MLTLNKNKFKYTALILCVFIAIVAFGGLNDGKAYKLDNTQFFCGQISLFFRCNTPYSLSGTELPRFEAWINENDLNYKNDFNSFGETNLILISSLLMIMLVIGQASNNFLNNLSKKTFYLRI